MTTNRIAFLLHLALLPVIGLGIMLTGVTYTAPVGGWVGHGAIDREVAAATAASKPTNEWDTQSLVKAGWTGCYDSDLGLRNGSYPTSHVVRLPAAEGFKWVRMDAAEVARRIEGFGGTPSIKDDVHIVGNCI